MKRLIQETFFIALLALIVILLMGCHRDTNDTLTAGTYLYSGHDLDGQKVTAGTITVTVTDSLIEGTKNIEIVGNNVGNVEDAGIGTIGGRINEDGSILIYLLEAHGPCVIIRGDYDNGVLKGKRYWGISGGAPEVRIGTYVAIKSE